MSKISLRSVRQSSERGNVLFLILIAVALFAALSYAVTSSTRSGGGNASKETLSTQIAQLESFGVAARTALQRMRLSGGLQLWQIDYSKVTASWMSANATCASATCRLHDAAGGGLAGQALPANFRQDAASCPNVSTWNGHYFFRNVSVKNMGVATTMDLMLLYPGVNKQLCTAINDKYGIANPGGNPPADADNNVSGTTDYSGTLTGEISLSPHAVELGDTATAIDGQPMFCLDNTDGCNYLWISLVER